MVAVRTPTDGITPSHQRRLRNRPRRGQPTEAAKRRRKRAAAKVRSRTDRPVSTVAEADFAGPSHGFAPGVSRQTA